MTRLIAAVDNSPATSAVLATASALARLLDADVEAVHVINNDGQTASANAERFGIPFRELPGDPLTRLIEEASASDVVAVAIGARGRLKARPAGHLARQLADAIDKPILVVPPNVAPADRFRTVVVAMESVAAKARGLDTAVDLAAGADLEIVVVHVDDEESMPSFTDQVAHEADAYASEFEARYLRRAPKARLELRVGIPSDEILDVTDDATADLLAIGWPRPSAKERGEVARQLLERSSVPLLLVAIDGGDDVSKEPTHDN